MNFLPLNIFQWRLGDNLPAILQRRALQWVGDGARWFLRSFWYWNQKMTYTIWGAQTSVDKGTLKSPSTCLITFVNSEEIYLPLCRVIIMNGIFSALDLEGMRYWAEVLLTQWVWQKDFQWLCYYELVNLTLTHLKIATITFWVFEIVLKAG